MKVTTPPTNFRALRPSQDVIGKALFELDKIQFDQNDRIYLRCIGAEDVFENGNEAQNFIKDRDIKVKFEKFEDPKIHARWDYPKNTIFINSSYSKLNDKAGILAISEAILHEAGHAKDGDEESSMQEELNCLALNVLAHRYHKKTYKDVFLGQSAPLFTQGVSLYEKLFFDFDLNKTQLKNRMKEVYGYLTPSGPKHNASKFIEDIKKINLTG